MMMILQMMKKMTPIKDKLNDFIVMSKEDYDNKSTGSEANEEEVVVDMEG